MNDADLCRPSHSDINHYETADNHIILDPKTKYLIQVDGVMYYHVDNFKNLPYAPLYATFLNHAYDMTVEIGNRTYRLITIKRALFWIKSITKKSGMPEIVEQELHKINAFEEYLAALSKPHTPSTPTPTSTTGHCVYVIEINYQGEKLYKFGRTNNIERRRTQHARDFKIGETLLTIPCSDFNASKKLERKIKSYAIKHGIYVQRERTGEGYHTELMRTDDIDTHVDAIKKLG